MTALIYKAALPTYSSAEDLAANAGENLLLNETGTAYELEPAQSGASVRSFLMLLAGTPNNVTSDNFIEEWAATTDPVTPIGMGASFDAGAPTLITIDEADAYSVMASFTLQRGTGDCTVQLAFVYNGDAAGPFYYTADAGVLSVATPNVHLNLSWPPFPMAEGDTIAVRISGAGATAPVIQGGTFVVAR